MNPSCAWVGRAAGIAVVLAMACQEKLPNAPAEVTTGVTIYEHANFGGASALVERDLEDLEDFRGPCQHTESTGNGTSTTVLNWGDCISSIRIAPGWQATVYRDDHFKGQSLETTTDVANLQLVAGSCDHDGLNDCISSIRVRQR
jgi:hypothetical protein